jgi:hypothetical protein
MRTFAVRMLAVMGLAAALGAGAPVSSAEPATAGQLLQRAERALDLKEIERLQRSYGYYIDQSDWDNVVDLLTDDATAEYALSGVYVGKASIRRLLYRGLWAARPACRAAARAYAAAARYHAVG